MRRRLPNRRRSENITYRDRNGTPVTATIGYYEDNQTIGEIFCRSGLVGTDLAISMNEVAIAVSMALQHGCSIDTLRNAMPRMSPLPGETVGAPEGAIGILLDLLAKQQEEVAA